VRQLLTLALLLMPATAYAQPKVDTKAANVLAWPEDKQWLAERIGDGLAIGSLVLPCLVNAAERSNPDCWKDQSIRTGAVLIITETTKRIAQRERPDGSDSKSFYSMHTALACVSSLNRLEKKQRWIGAALCASVGYLRIAADKHWTTDVLVGGGLGVAAAFSWGRE
jgi:hypothetical protein